ncbi:MAG TPA: AtpZ/AtpI family protein [Azospirillaceae bacterium]|nr:AtpZ/AtpI family protein [Azospirillaceae bacterium]
MTEDRPTPSLDEIEARLREARRGSAPAHDPSAADGADRDNGRGGLGLAFRVGVDIVAALVVGVGGGMLLDRWLGTAPWGLIVMFFLGAAAGLMNVYRTVNGLGMGVGFSPPPAQDGGQSNGSSSDDRQSNQSSSDDRRT